MVSLNKLSPEQVSQVNFLGEGKYRRVYQIGDDKVLKLLKPKTKKGYGLLHIDIPPEKYIKFGLSIEDFNQFELDNYKKFIEKIPDSSKEYFSKIHWAGKYNGISASVSDLVMNDDGSPSQTLSQMGKINDKIFWEKMNLFKKVSQDNDVLIMDMHGGNIAVKEGKEYKSPVLIDYKSVGNEKYPFQFWFYSKEQLKRKFEIKFEKLRKNHQ